MFPQLLPRTSVVCALASCVALCVPSAAGAASVAPEVPATERLSVHALLRDEPQLAGWLNQHSPDLLAARARALQAQADASATRLLPNPVLDGSLGNIPLGETTPPGLSFDQVAIYSMGLSETIELGKRGPRQDAASLRARSAALLAEGALGERLAAARTALGLAVHLGSRLVILDESLQAAERGAELERSRFEQKALSGMDYDRLLLELASLKAEFARSQAEYAAALAACPAVIGADCDLGGASEDDLAAAVPVAITPESEQRLLERPELRAFELDRAAAERDADLAHARAIPDPTLRVGYTYDRFVVSGDNRHTLALNLQLPLPFFDHGQYDADKALGHAQEVAQTRSAALAAARAELAGLARRKATLEQNLDVLERDTLPRSQSVLESAQHAFDIGGTSLTDLLLARRNHISLELTRLDQRFELFSVRNELYRLLALNGATHP